ncbi:Phosphatidate phosphatase APP1 [Lasiodiplodia hormozganensis]|uniref:Phosphatidate phosphatase APP1 n=1 Tax=Lasiodiplodia hormozganensis TaxID=869390 RepID=A0AA40CWH6_9PEZI|nr:Phosphatidate phosphatase APP1 [Lasiodiplodia hormozganensis]
MLPTLHRIRPRLQLAPKPFRRKPTAHRPYLSPLRFLFPHTRLHARQRLETFRHEYLPSLRHRAQSRIWQYILRRQQKRLHKAQNALGNFRGSRILALLRGTRTTLNDSPKENVHSDGDGSGKMSSLGAGRYYSGAPYVESDTDDGTLSGLRTEREPGARRKKLAGYLKAANELRQAYQQSYTRGWGSGGGDRLDWDQGDDTPGAFPDAAIIRSGDEEMVLFPSYARKHVKRKPQAVPGTIQESPGYGRDARDSAGAGDAEFWRKEFEKYEDDNAVVDVDVRGWIYYPHRGQMTRKHRLFVGLARQLVGLPAPSSKSSRPPSREPSPHRSIAEKAREKSARQEEELVEKEAISIMRRGEMEIANAEKGGYSETPSKGSDSDSLYTTRSRDVSPARGRPGRLGELSENDALQKTGMQKRESWIQPAHMNPSELEVANKHLMSRLLPFLSNPLANTPISIFFYNEEISRQRTIYTDAAGHFTVRAALDFVPTHIRVIVSETLSTTAEVHITEPKGVSLISDIDDTIKHSAISSGAREIFRNAFIRELGDLTIEGVREWYHALYDQGVRFHYVSNSPWQLYPVISQYFKLAGLPPGSFHLKQYSGMLQGIFEPVAERKKATLDRLARDFPQRSFILVGDSGEADLEVYTDFVLENPGRVVAVFIRDVTTPVQKGFFDPSTGPSGSGKSSKRNSKVLSGRRSARSSRASEDDDPELRAAIAASLREFEDSGGRYPVWTPGHSPTNSEFELAEKRPALPPRRPTEPAAPEAHRMNPPMGKLIDLSDDDDAASVTSTSSAPPPLSRNISDPTSERLLEPIAEAPLQRSNAIRGRTSPSFGERRAPPAKPSKPMRLRSPSQENISAAFRQASPAKPAPPPIRRPSTEVKTSQARGLSPLGRPAHAPEAPPDAKASAPPPPPPRRTETSLSSQSTYAGAARNKLAQAYNSLPAASTLWNGTSAPSEPSAGGTSSAAAESKKIPPPPPPRRTGTSLTDGARDSPTSRTPTLSANSPSIGNGDFENRRPYTANAASGSSTSLNTKPSFASNASGATPTSAPNGGAASTGNKREDLWRKRLARAEQTLGERGVVLRTWRVGEDVMDEALKLVSTTLERQTRERSDSKGDELRLISEQRINSGPRR